MFDAVVDVLSQTTPNPLKMIRIVIFQQGMLKDFHNSMQKKEVGDTKDKDGLWGKIKGRKSGKKWSILYRLIHDKFSVDMVTIRYRTLHVLLLRIKVVPVNTDRNNNNNSKYQAHLYNAFFI